MAELTQQSQTTNGRQKKLSNRIDMTAMVDVAFLLLTFFILTTTMAPDYVMNFMTPPKGGETSNQAESKMLTLILGAEDQVYYYYGAPDENLEVTDFSTEGIRNLLMGHIYKPDVPTCRGKDKSPGCWDPIISIKTTDKARYENLIDVLDEIKISAAPLYAWAPLSPADSTLLSFVSL